MESPESPTRSTPPRWFLVVSIVALVWTLLGLLSFIMDPLTSEAALAEMTEVQREIFESRPTWLFVVYGISVLSGLAGAIGLLMRRGWAVPAFAVSLAFIVIQFGYVLFGLNALGLLGPLETLPLPLVILTFGVLLLWLSLHARREGWIGSHAG